MPRETPGGFFSKDVRDTPLADRIEATLGRLGVRILLSLLILLSLIPHPAESTSDLVFLAIFGLEFSARLVVFVARVKAPREEHRARNARRHAVSVLLLAFDLLALLSFFPWGELFGGLAAFESRLLRVFRLLRMLLFVGYWAPILQDGLAVLTRHDRLRQVSLLGLVVGLLAFAGATLLAHLPVAGVDFTGDNAVDGDDERFWPRLWWAFRQIQDPGNMVSDPGELAVVIVSLGLTVAGLFVVSFLIGLATDIVRELVEVARNRPVGWKRHTVVVFASPGLPQLLTELGHHYERLLRRPRFVVADLAPEPPAALRSGELANVRWRQIDERGTGLTAMADVATARRIVIHASARHPFPDATTAATILDVREASATPWVVAEVLDPNNIAATRVAGGQRTVIVPTEKLLGIWALAAIRRPEQMPLAWELLATRGGYEFYTFFFDADGLDGPGAAWDAGPTELADLLALAASRRWHEPRLRRRVGDVLPIGVVREPHPSSTASGDQRPPELGVLALNPRGPLGGPERRPIRAVVAIAQHFDDLARYARFAYTHAPQPEARSPRPPRDAPQLGRPARPRRPRRILACGFRPASAVTIAGLVSEGEDVEVTVAMLHSDSVRAATQALREHGLGSQGPSSTSAARRCFAGHFEPDGASATSDASSLAFRWVPLDGRPAGRVTLVQADWTSERTLLGLEPGIEHISRYELVLLLGSHLPEYDGRTSMAVLKIADIARASAARFPTRPEQFRVLAGIADAELGQRLLESYRRACGRELELLSTESLRALFMFQSIAVPGWELIFTTLLGPGDEGLLHLPVQAPAPPQTPASAPTPSPTRHWSLPQLAEAFYQRGLLVVGVELLRDGVLERRLASTARDQTFLESELVAVWALGDEG